MCERVPLSILKKMGWRETQEAALNPKGRAEGPEKAKRVSYLLEGNTAAPEGPWLTQCCPSHILGVCTGYVWTSASVTGSSMPALKKSQHARESWHCAGESWHIGESQHAGESQHCEGESWRVTGESRNAGGSWHNTGESWHRTRESQLSTESWHAGETLNSIESQHMEESRTIEECQHGGGADKGGKAGCAERVSYSMRTAGDFWKSRHLEECPAMDT